MGNNPDQEPGQSIREEALRQLREAEEKERLESIERLAQKAIEEATRNDK